MKVDFNQIKTTISLPDFLLELGWKSWKALPTPVPKWATERIPSSSSGTRRTNTPIGTCIVTACVAAVSWIWCRNIYLKQPENAVLARGGGDPSELHQHQPHHDTRKSRYEVGNTSMRADELQFYLSQLQPYKGNYLQKEVSWKKALKAGSSKTLSLSVR